jgi:hypothetical protein
MNALALAATAVMMSPAAASAEPAVTGYPSSLAALGDSITRGYDADGVYPPGERLQYSWAEGTSTTVDSFYLRLLAANPAIIGHALNDAVTGAEMTDPAAQATNPRSTLRRS